MGALDAGSEPAAEERRSAAVRPSVKTAGPAEGRQAGSHSKFRLAMLAVVIVLVGACAGGLGSLLLPKEYAARAQLQYSLPPGTAMPNELLRKDRRLQTQLVLLHSQIVLGPLASDIGMRPEDLANEVSAEVVDGSEIIEVEVRDRSQKRAERVLTGIVARYIGDANTDWQDPVASYLESQLDDVQKKLRAPNLSEADAFGMAQQEKLLIGLEDGRRSQLSNPPDSTSPGAPARVVVPPYQVGEMVSPRPLLAIATGAATALVVACFVVLLVARRRLRS